MILLLGSGLSHTQGLLEASGCRTWNDFYEKMKNAKEEQIPKVEEYFGTLGLQEGYRCIVQLMQEGYIKAVFTVNTDTLFKQTLEEMDAERNGIKILRDDIYQKEWIKQRLNKQISSSEKSVYFLHGFINQTCKLAFAEIVQFGPTLEGLLKPYLMQNLLMVNFTGLGDCDLLHAIPAQGQEIWWISSEQNQRVLDYLPTNRYKNKEIVGEAARFNDFFRTLLEMLRTQEEPRTIRDVPRSESVSEEVDPVQVVVIWLGDALPSSVLQLYKAEEMPLVKYELSNNTNHPVYFFLEVAVQDNPPWKDTVRVSPRSSKEHYQLPRLRVEQIKEISEIRSVSAYVSVTYRKEAVIYKEYEQTYSIDLLAYNVICWAIPNKDKEKEGEYIELFEHIARWVMPQSEATKTILHAAMNYYKEKWPERSLPVGYGHKTDLSYISARKQVQAIYEYVQEKLQLSDRGMPVPTVPNNGARWQTVQIPKDTLEWKMANCIDRVVLYASLIRLANLEPMILIKGDPTQGGHALVGWKTRPGKEDYEFLETMSSPKTPFHEAIENGAEQYNQIKQDEWLERKAFDKKGFSRLLNINYLHENKIYPMPI